ncbi:hypothetical protein HK405_009719, partial [Cladochytrium tenue]
MAEQGKLPPKADLGSLGSFGSLVSVDALSDAGDDARSGIVHAISYGSVDSRGTGSTSK